MLFEDSYLHREPEAPWQPDSEGKKASPRTENTVFSMWKNREVTAEKAYPHKIIPLRGEHIHFTWSFFFLLKSNLSSRNTASVSRVIGHRRQTKAFV